VAKRPRCFARWIQCPANVDPAAGALEELKRIIAQIRGHWPQVQILVRGDSAYSREDIMSWCESQTQVELVLAHSSNARLRQSTWHLEQRAKAAYDAQCQLVAASLETLLGQSPTELASELNRLVPPQVWYQSLTYRTQDSWSCERRLVCKLTYDGSGPRRHFVVTSWSAEQVHPAHLHRDFYCPRGEMENRIKEHQLDLFSDRTSTHDFESNQLRLWFSSFAYVLSNPFVSKLSPTLNSPMLSSVPFDSSFSSSRLTFGSPFDGSSLPLAPLPPYKRFLPPLINSSTDSLPLDRPSNSLQSLHQSDFPKFNSQGVIPHPRLALGGGCKRHKI
jgi:hypothetical protein